MSYLEQTGRKNPASIAAVVGVHLAVGYALISGFAITVIKDIPRIPQIVSVNDPPPPKEHPRDLPRTKPTTVTQTQPKQIDDHLKTEPQILKMPDLGETSGTFGGGGPQIVLPKAEPAHPSLAVDALPGRDRLRWITTDDYPTAALRQDVQGSVAISVMIGVDGKVRSCLVTQSSGSKLLDDATCRLYMARAHFTPARDADGNPTIAQRTDRYRWQIPQE